MPLAHPPNTLSELMWTRTPISTPQLSTRTRYRLRVLLHHRYGVLSQIPPKLMRVCKEELPASSLEAAMLTMGALDDRGRVREGDEGTLIRLCVEETAMVRADSCARCASAHYFPLQTTPFRALWPLPGWLRRLLYSS